MCVIYFCDVDQPIIFLCNLIKFKFSNYPYISYIYQADFDIPF